VVNSPEDFAKLPELGTIDKTVAEVKTGTKEAIPTLNVLPIPPIVAEGSAVIQVRNAMDSPILVYFSGKKSCAVRVPPGDPQQAKPGLWHVILPAGKYEVAMKPDAAGAAPGKPGPNPAYGEQEYKAGTAYYMEFTATAQ